MSPGCSLQAIILCAYQNTPRSSSIIKYWISVPYSCPLAFEKAHKTLKIYIGIITQGCQKNSRIQDDLVKFPLDQAKGHPQLV